MVRAGAFLVIAGLAVGCMAQSDDIASDDSASQTDDISATSRTYVVARTDGSTGYYVHDVNRTTLNEKHVTGFDFTGANLDADAIADALGAADGELVLHGKLGPTDSHGNRAFLVTEAYRGMPGFTPTSDATYYFAAPRSPQITCFTAPCNDEMSTKLNSTSTTSFTSLDVSAATATRSDPVWLADHALASGVVAGKFVKGAHEAGGYDSVLAASQVFVKLPVTEGACPQFVVDCGSQTPTYTRDANRCEIFASCVDHGPCSQLVPSCPAGYTLASWPTAPNACPAFACDATFTE